MFAMNRFRFPRVCSSSSPEARLQMVFPKPVKYLRRTSPAQAPVAKGCYSDRIRTAVGVQPEALHAGLESHSALLGEAEEAGVLQSLRADIYPRRRQLQQSRNAPPSACMPRS